MTNPQDLRTIFAKAINKYVAKNLVVNPLRILEQIHIEGIADVCTALLSTPPDEAYRLVEDALNGAVDSLEYVQEAHPEATGYGVRRERIAKAKAALSVLATQQWQDISTAPHQKYVLAIKQNDSSGVCHVMWSSTERDTLADMGFTHWMPLPTPPKPQDK